MVGKGDVKMPNINREILEQNGEMGKRMFIDHGDRIAQAYGDGKMTKKINNVRKKIKNGSSN